ncbi:MAG TPA: hypothetical protein VG755_16255, partial [Nannocystaceae bacterium]|nr:hypothetical protein [Nannocystaceae bacterium]
MRRVACLAVLATACSTTPVAPEPLPAKVEPTPSPPAPTLVIDVLQGFTGDAHDVIALPDGECIAALSWFGDTDYGAGPRRTDDRGRQGVLVRYRVDGSVRWASDVKVWPADLVFDGKDRVLVVGDPRDGTTNWIVLDAATGAITQSGLLEGYAKAAAFARTG